MARLDERGRLPPSFLPSSFFPRVTISAGQTRPSDVADILERRWPSPTWQMAPTPDLRHGHPSSRHYGGCLAFPVSRSFTPREESNRFSLPHSLSRNPPSLFLLEPTNYRFSFFVFRRIEIRERLESDMIIGRMGGKSMRVLREYQRGEEDPVRGSISLENWIYQ